MKVLHMIDALGVGGGAEHALAGLIPALSEHGVESSVMCLDPRDGGLQEQLRSAGTGVVVVGTAPILHQVRRARQLIKQQRPDVVHATIWQSCLVSRLACIGLDVSLVNSIVNTSYDPVRTASLSIAPWKLALVRWADRLTLKMVDRVHVLTETVAKEAREVLHVPAEKLVVIPRGRSRQVLGWRTAERRSAVRRSLGIDDEAFVVLNVGRQDAQKAQDLLVRAFARVVESVPHSILLIAGRPGDASDELQAAIDEHQLDDSVRLLGHRDDVADLIVAADAFAFPSLYEGLGSVLIEAMALETPIVASDAPALVEVLDQGRSGIIVPRNDAVGLSTALRGLSTSGDTSKLLAERALRTYEQRYVLSSVVAATLLMYTELGGSSHARGRSRQLPRVRRATAHLPSVLRAAFKPLVPRRVRWSRNIRHAISAGERELLVVQALLSRGDVFVDVGAHRGIYSAAAMLEGATAIAIEPRDEMRAALRQLLGPAARIEITAVSDVCGTSEFFVPTTVDGQVGTRSSLSATANPGFDLETRTVPTARLDDLCATASFIKIDVEGTELKVLESSRRLLTSSRPFLLVEIEQRHSDSPHGAFELLTGLGYRSYYLDPGGESLRLSPAIDIDFDSLQTPDRAKIVGQARDPRYVNNFLFVHETRLDAAASSLSGSGIHFLTE